MKQALPEKTPTSTARAALLFGSGTLTSRILGLIRDSLLFSLLPLEVKDAWFASFRLPNFFRRLLGEGGLSVSFIPLYVTLAGEEGARQRKALVDGVFTLLMSLVSLVCLLSFVFMDSIIGYWLSGPGFTGIPGKIEMTISMARIMIFFLFFITLFAYFMAILNANKKFTLSGYAPLFLNVSIIGGLWWFRDSESLIQASAWSVVIGGFLQALFLLPPLVKLNSVPRPTLHWNSPIVKKVLWKFLPTVFGVGVLQTLTLINVYFASRIHGAISYIYLGDRLLELPLSLIAVSIGTTLLPTLSGYWGRGERSTFIDSLSKHLSLFYFLALPSAFGLWFLGIDIIDILFKRGEFRAQEVLVVGQILKIYCISLMAAGSLKILNQALYATGDTLTPAIVSLFGILIHILLAPQLMDLYGLNGLVFSTASITVFNLLCCLTVVQRRIEFLRWRKISRHFLSCAIASSVMGAYLWSMSLFDWKQGRFLLDFPLLMLIVAFAGVIYFGVAALLKVEELGFVLRKIKRS